MWEAFQAPQLSCGPPHAIEKPGIFLGSFLYKLFLLLGTWNLRASGFSSLSLFSIGFLVPLVLVPLLSPSCSWGLFSSVCSEIRTGITTSTLLGSRSQALAASRSKARLAPADRQGRRLLRAASFQWQQIIQNQFLDKREKITAGWWGRIFASWPRAAGPLEPAVSPAIGSKEGNRGVGGPSQKDNPCCDNIACLDAGQGSWPVWG